MKATSTPKTRAEALPRPRPSLRARGLQVLFFVALAVFGFSVVTRLVSGGGITILEMPPIPRPALDPEPAVAIGPQLYETASLRPVPAPSLSPIFMPSVQYWRDQIMDWAADYGVDPNLVATVMQIESCGNPRAGSSVGAMGLFQVMPFHFEAGEEPYDPDTNAARGIAFLAGGLELSGGHAGLALAGYNGGHSLIYRSYEDWPRETQRYYRWGSGIYREASAGWDSSSTLVAWLAAGGHSLCTEAAEVLGLPSGEGSQTQ